MSVQATTWVWEHSKSTGTARLVLLAIADAANREGKRSFQSAPSIARMTGVSKRSVWRCIEALEELGEIRKTGIHGEHGTTVYEIPGVSDWHAEEPSSRANLTRDKLARRATGGKPAVPSGVSAVPATGTQPHKTPKETPLPKRSTQISENFTPTEDMLLWAKADAPFIDAGLETQQFIDHHLGKGSLMKDWNRAWKTWMRNAQKWATERNPTRKPNFNPNDWMNQ